MQECSSEVEIFFHFHTWWAVFFALVGTKKPDVKLKQAKAAKLHTTHRYPLLLTATSLACILELARNSDDPFGRRLTATSKAGSKDKKHPKVHPGDMKSRRAWVRNKPCDYMLRGHPPDQNKQGSPQSVQYTTIQKRGYCPSNQEKLHLNAGYSRYENKLKWFVWFNSTVTSNFVMGFLNCMLVKLNWSRISASLKCTKVALT